MLLKTRKVLDIESNGLLADMLDFSKFPYRIKEGVKLWCVVVRDVDTDHVDKITIKDGITREWFEKVLANTEELITHNGIKFDLLVLKLMGLIDYEIGYLDRPDKLFGFDVKITDTLIRSRLFNPDRHKGHSLDAWGERLGEPKTDFRAACIEAGLLERNAPKGTEFLQYSDIMVDYCVQDTKVTALVHKNLQTEFESYKGWTRPEKLENKLADLAIRRESYGFWFDKDAAIAALEELTKRMDALESNVNPLLPPKPLGKTELKNYKFPARYSKSDGKGGKVASTALLKFAEKHGMTRIGEFLFEYKGSLYQPDYPEYLETTRVATINDLDHVKSYLIELGWNPIEFKVRDLTKDSKKQNLTYEKRVAALDRWLEETFTDGKYKHHRLEELNMGSDKTMIRAKLVAKLTGDKPVRVPTSPCVRTGVEKELCKNLQKLGEKVAFAKDFVLYLTYKHRKSSIAGGDIEDMDFDDEYPNSGFLSMYREVDGRVPTPAIEIGASTNRYRHIGVCNIARASSIFGKEMRSLFGCGAGMVQLGFDFSSLEAREQGHYIWNYTGGQELAAQLLAKKPNDIHTLNAIKLFGTADMRDQAKSISYMLMYGGSASRAKAMLGISMKEAEKLVQEYWDAVPALRDLRDDVTRVWKARGSKYVIGIDGRKIMTRSAHSLLNALFQSAGVINAKYATVFIYQLLEDQGLKCNPFEHEELDMCGMIEYHDECQLAVNPKHIQYKIFDTEDEAKAFTKTWEGDQLGAPSEAKNGKFAVALPNVVSRAISEGIRMSVAETKLKVDLGMEWVVHKNWYGCH